MKPAWNYNPDPENGRITLYTPKSYQVFANHPKFAEAFDAFRANNVDEFINIADPTAYIKSLYAKYESIEVRDGNVYVDGLAINTLVAEHILDFLSKGIDCVPIFKFVIKLQNNPSKRAVDEAYTWLANRSFAFTDTGNVLGYKAVRSDYLDIYSGTFNNTVGQVHSMPRNKVDDDKEHGCSYGFHVGTQEYATGFCSQNGHIMAVEFDPADIVSVPSDCNFQKLRVCRYMVVEELEGIMEEVYKARLSSDNDSLFESWDNDEDCTDDNTYCDYCSEVTESVCEECSCCCDCCECPRCNDCGEVDMNLSDNILCSNCEPSCECSEPTEIQLELNLDNKIQNHWQDERFEYLKMLNWLYAHQRPAVANAMRRFYKDCDDHHLINPEFSILLQFTSTEDAFKIYQDYKSQ